MIQTFRLEGLDERFNIAILLRTSCPYQFYLATHGIENNWKMSQEQRISVMNQILGMEKFPIPHVRLVAGNLRHPIAIWIVCNAAAPDFPCMDVLKEQYMNRNHIVRLLGICHDRSKSV